MKNLMLLIIVFVVSSTSLAQDLFTFEKSKEFANYLFANNEYELAQPEYQRLFFTNSSDSIVATRYLLCNYSLQNYSKTIQVYEQYLMTADSGNSIIEDIYYRSLVLSNSPYTNRYFDNSYNEYASFYELTHLMLNSDWKNAHNLFQHQSGDIYCGRYASILLLQENLKYKKKTPAIVLSTFIPGAGKAYAGYWQDAIFSFVCVGLSAWQSYRGFHQKGAQSVYGWLYGSIGAGFYIGNLFGSVKAVNKHNYELNHELHHQVRHTFISTPF